MPIATTIATRMTSTFSRQTGVPVRRRVLGQEGVEPLRFFVRGLSVAGLHRGLHFLDLASQLGEGGFAQAIAPVANQFLRVPDEKVAVLDVARLEHWANAS